ncbi:VOC family protein [Paraburkholderia susongensis]|uniref:Glyoxalase-like domain-containing protein n=1 Tax=Paraburkholderia susongensis TaxID=1515439 RepID=A0A1X7KXE8_9BURK|nr:VOC family protein [Paraburkholderia susongensis]SMG46241.1 Glyoxalase-like domain-containing protein [Paraburkholderia susongensis]
MTAHSLSLDHLVISARTLEEGEQYVADALGVAPAGGGAHPLMRTHNRLLGLWGGVYLEVIAIDPHASAAHAATHAATRAAADSGTPRPRLFALDDPATHARLENGPYLSHWVARVERPKRLAAWQAQYPQRIAPVVPMTRGDFTWGLTVPDDGSFPAWQGAGDGVLPSLIQWDSACHPSQVLAPANLALKALKAVHPQAALIGEQLRWLGAEHLLDVQSTGGAAALVAEFETPEGPRTLS